MSCLGRIRKKKIDLHPDRAPQRRADRGLRSMVLIAAASLTTTRVAAAMTAAAVHSGCVTKAARMNRAIAMTRPGQAAA